MDCQEKLSQTTTRILIVRPEDTRLVCEFLDARRGPSQCVPRPTLLPSHQNVLEGRDSSRTKSLPDPSNPEKSSIFSSKTQPIILKNQPNNPNINHRSLKTITAAKPNKNLNQKPHKTQNQSFTQLHAYSKNQQKLQAKNL